MLSPLTGMVERHKVIVLKTHTYRESDIIVSGLSAAGKRMTFIARAGLKSRKRFGGGVLEPTRYIEVLAKSSAVEGKWPELQEAFILKDFAGLRKDYGRLESAFTLLEWVLKIIPEGGGGFQDVFHLLGRAFEQMEQTDNSENLRRLVQLKLLALQGILAADHEWQVLLRMPLVEHASFTPDRAQSRELENYLQAVYRDYVGIKF